MTIAGEQKTRSLELFAPPFSLIQTSLPGGDFGRLTLTVTTDDATAPWLFYGSTIENTTSVASSVVGVP